MAPVLHWLRSVLSLHAVDPRPRSDHHSFEHIDCAQLELDECRHSGTLGVERMPRPHDDFVETLPASHHLSIDLLPAAAFLAKWRRAA